MDSPTQRQSPSTGLFISPCACNICSVCVGAIASMADRYVARQAFRIIFLCILWYIVSSSNNVIGKILLSEFPYPMTVTMVHLVSITIYSGPFFNLWGVRRFVDISWRYYFKFIVPLALGKFLASVFSHVSIWKVPVSYAHTGKYIRPHSITIQSICSNSCFFFIFYFS